MNSVQQNLPDLQQSRRDEFEDFVQLQVAPFAAQWDQHQRLPDSALSALAQAGYLGCLLPRDYGGQGQDAACFGLLNEVLGQASSSLTVVITVQTMVTMALLKWGTPEQKRQWLPALASGELIGGFALTEPDTGSDLKSMTTSFTQTASGYVLNGSKKWISCGQFAGMFLVFGKLGEHSMACLLPRETPGLRIQPITEMLGFRSAGLAQLFFDNVPVPASNIVGKPGFALSHVAPVGLHYGRLSTANSALGLLNGCFEESIMYACMRQLGEKSVGDRGMIRSLITRMGTDVEATRLLCHNACSAVDQRLPEAIEKTLIAKYAASTAAVRAACDALQIHGASGFQGASRVARYYRDAKVMEIIEGTTQVHEDILGRIFVARGRTLAAAKCPPVKPPIATSSPADELPPAAESRCD